MLEVEKRFDDSYFKICNIRLLSSLERSLETLRNYLEFPDREVQRMALMKLSLMLRVTKRSGLVF